MAYSPTEENWWREIHPWVAKPRMGELKFSTSHEWDIPKARLSPKNGLAEVVKKNSPTSGKAARGGIFFSPQVPSHEWGKWECAMSDEWGILLIPISLQTRIYIPIWKGKLHSFPWLKFYLNQSAIYIRQVTVLDYRNPLKFKESLKNGFKAYMIGSGGFIFHVSLFV